MIMINILILKNLTSKSFTAKLKQANLTSKYDIANFNPIKINQMNHQKKVK